MKKLVSPGLTLIVSQYSFSRRRRFDPWCTHGHFHSDWETEPYSSHDWALAASFTLSDGHDYLYAWGHFPNESAAAGFFLAYQKFQSANGRVGFIGEWFNSICRGQPTEKYLIL
jgi:hypothetical protein